MYHTLGQRKGLRIGGQKCGATKTSTHHPWFVAGKDMERNILYVVQGHDHPALLGNTLNADQLSWIAESAPRPNWVYTARPRYRSSDEPCYIESLGERQACIRFAESQWALTPGQSVVLYESLVCLGGGIIESSNSGQINAAQTPVPAAGVPV